MTTSEKPSRQTATARGSACESRARGPANERPTAARKRTAEAGMAGIYELSSWAKRRTWSVFASLRRTSTLQHAHHALEVLVRIPLHVVEQRADVRRQLVHTVVERLIREQAVDAPIWISQHLRERIARL